MTRLEIAARILAGWAANPPNVSGKNEEAAAVSLALADALLAAAGETAPADQYAAPAEKPAPVKFDADGRALLASGNAAKQRRDGWEASTDGEEFIAVYLTLRPGEDAGEVTARMLASVGRSV